MGVARLARMLAVAAVLLQLNQADAYSKYGRGCADIGCLPSEECVITSDSCSYNQRDGKDCGNYPTCKRKIGSSNNQANPSSSSVNPSGSSLNTGPENNIFAPASSNPTLNTFTYFNHNNNNNNNNQQQLSQSGGQQKQNGGSGGGMGVGGGGGGLQNGGHSGSAGQKGNSESSMGSLAAANGAAGASAAGIDPHYVFGAKLHMPIIPNMPIFPYNSPTSAPSFQQFPQPNHPGSVLNPGYPMHGLQPVNPYNPPYVFGQLPFYSGPAGTGGPPGGGAGGIGAGVGLPSSSIGILGGGGGGLAPYGSNYQGYNTHHSNANMYNKPPPQYQNQNQQNPYNRQTQAHPSAASARCGGTINVPLVGVLALLVLLVANRRAGSGSASGRGST